MSRAEVRWAADEARVAIRQMERTADGFAADRDAAQLEAMNLRSDAITLERRLEAVDRACAQLEIDRNGPAFAAAVFAAIGRSPFSTALLAIASAA